MNSNCDYAIRRARRWSVGYYSSLMRSRRFAGAGLSLLFMGVGSECLAAGGGGLMDPSKDMMIWTWVTFGILFIILYKLAWKPILTALDKRESDIRAAVDNADRVKEELAKVEERREKLIREADDKAKEIVATARKAAVEASRVIEERAKEEAKILLENATADIKAARENAEAGLRRDSAALAVSLAGKLIGENLDDEKNRALVDRLIAEV